MIYQAALVLIALNSVVMSQTYLPFIFIQGISAGGSSNSTLQIEAVKFGLICRVNCGRTRSCRPQMKILAQSSPQLALPLGRLVKVKKEGTFIALCYLKSTEKETKYTFKVFISRRRLSSFEIAEMKTADEAPSISSWNVKIKVDKASQQYRVICSISRPIDQQSLLKLYRISKNGSRSEVAMNPRQLSASLNGSQVEMQYNHDLAESDDYFTETFECAAVHKFSLAEKSVRLESDQLTNWFYLPPPEQMVRKCMDSFTVENKTAFSKYVNGFPIIDSIQGYLKCSCEGTIPRTKIYWENLSGERFLSNKIYVKDIDSNSSTYCCVGQQTLTSGGSQFVQKSCWTINKSDIKLITKSSQLHPILQDPKNESYFLVGGMLGKKSHFPVYFDSKDGNTKWITVQKRLNGSLSFSKSWIHYKNGFGDLKGEFWLGNEILHQLTSAGLMTIRFDMWNNDGNHFFAQYSSFAVSNESDNYRLTISGYSGNAEDKMAYHDKIQFSTKDRDNDEDSASCSMTNGYTGWWFKRCSYANLNRGNNYIQWGTIESIRKTQIKIAYK